MSEERRNFLKMAAGAGAVGVATLLKAGSGMASEETPVSSTSNGVVVGKSTKKEILYKKTEHWDRYYKSSY